MHLSLSDLLTCPRCGPAHGLVLLPEQVRDRRVVSGVLGCPNCRRRYPIDHAVADLRTSPDPEDLAGPEFGSEPEPEPEPGSEPELRPEGPLRLAAGLGLAHTRGAVALAGPAASFAAELARLVEGVEVVVLGGADLPAGEPGDVSRLRVGPRLPFRDGVLAGVVLTGWATDLFGEGVRVLRPAARLLLEPATVDHRGLAEGAGLVRILDANGTLIVARRS